MKAKYVIDKNKQTIKRLRAKVRYLKVLVAEIDMALEGTEYDGVVTEMDRILSAEPIYRRKR